MNERRARLALADGTVLTGRAVGAAGTSWGEVVFNTGMSGYTEVLSDPSYRGQIVVMTQPHIGNYGVSREDLESRKIHLSGFCMRELSPIASNFRSELALEEWLSEQGIVAVDEIDTRAVTRRLRAAGSMAGILTTEDDASDEELVARAANLPSMEGRALTEEVARCEPERWEQGVPEAFAPRLGPRRAGARVAVLDFGVKHNILRLLVAHGFEVEVIPGTLRAEAVLERGDQGVLISNGPGDPAALPAAIETVRGLLGKVPLFGICLGHQLLGAAAGAALYKMKFGHHGCNHPVQEIETGRVAVTSQNHGFAVDEESLAGVGAIVTHRSLNDGTVEGLALPDRAAFSVQFHPEAAPGPRDMLGVFARFQAALGEGSPS